MTRSRGSSGEESTKSSGGPTRREAVAVSVAALGGAAALTAGLPTAAAAATAAPRTAPAVQPWRDRRKSAARRADALLAAMTLQEQITLVTAVDVADFAPLAHLGVPAMTRVDASDGLRGDTGATAFPAPNALAATFDTALAERYGAAIGAEARGKGWNVLLGPTVDIDRNPRNGREAESYGEDPLVNGLIGAAVTRGFQKNDVIAQIKHFTVYNQEEGRNTLDVRVSERALREVHYPAFEHTVRGGGALSVMGSYPRVNGVFACENPHLIGALKNDLGLKGYLGTDYYPSGDRVAEINAGVDSAALTPDTPKAAFTDGRIPQERTRDATRRILYALFASGAYDHPLPETPAEVVTTAAHQALARITGEQATVLLRNKGGLLPLSRNRTVAVIGPAGKDAITGVEGSSYVDPGDFTTALDAIRAKSGASRVLFSQGSLGDVALPTIPGAVLTTPDGEPGLHAECFAGEDHSGSPLTTTTAGNIDFRGAPVGALPAAWSARWTGRLTPPVTGPVRISALLAGAAKIVVDGVTLLDESRFLWDSFFGPKESAIGGVTELTGGRAVDITVEYSTRDAGFRGPGLTLGWQPESLIPAAVATAKKADVAVVFVNNYTGEAFDRDNLSLPGDQDRLIEAVAAANPNTVVVLNTSGPVLMPWLGKVKGVLQAWYQGAATGTGIANILYGDAEPGGRLPVTFPADEQQGPATYTGANNDNPANTIAYDEGIYIGYKWYDKHGARPLFPFGHGLSYTSFRYGTARVRSLGRGDQAAEVTVEVHNTGRRTGSEVVQVYAGHLPTRADTPARTLVGFARVELEAGRRRSVGVTVSRRALSYWDERGGRWVTPTGQVPVYVGRSAADLDHVGSITVK
ncbi:beta-glucosidase [Streptomyces dioscori]|uniref:Beta-glucosidase n=1 Tax=Streptomyces dioscori TaxID=2109333 RepID=A0A2P8QFJ4_9ACTN|nr:glycoside hydrolase family 3 C-terminal domain-containing protein [Streptomyces dioscori]PSM45007.1 beta-glucosidase [Streptomyces dioscori]